MSHIYWAEPEIEALARETAVGLKQANINTVPSLHGNGGFLKPIIIAAQRRCLRPHRQRLVFGSANVVGKRYWSKVPRYLDELQKANGATVHGPEAPPAPPPEPPKPKPLDLKEIPDGVLLAEFLIRMTNMFGKRQEVVVNIPAMDHLRAEVMKQVTETVTVTNETLQEMRVQMARMKMQVDKLKPAPPSIMCLGASEETQIFLRKKSDEASLDVDFRFVRITEPGRPFKADYVLMFGQVGNDWDRYIQMATPKSHQCFISGRHDQAMIQLKSWLGA